MEVAISLGSILVASFVFYFVIKWAVKNGINESMLFSDNQRKEQVEKKQEERNEICKDFPWFKKESKKEEKS